MKSIMKRSITKKSIAWKVSRIFGFYQPVLTANMIYKELYRDSSTVDVEQSLDVIT